MNQCWCFSSLAVDPQSLVEVISLVVARALHVCCLRALVLAEMVFLFVCLLISASVFLSLSVGVSLCCLLVYRSALFCVLVLSIVTFFLIVYSCCAFLSSVHVLFVSFALDFIRVSYQEVQE